ncbi:MAG: ABC transporter substrate-binding protein [Bacillota bacterium]
MLKSGRLLLLLTAIFVVTGSILAYLKIIEMNKEYSIVRLAECSPSVYKLPHYIAREFFYREQNIKIEAVDCGSEKDALDRLERGEADVALVSPSALVIKRSSDLKEGGPVIVASFDSGAVFHLVAKKNTTLEDIGQLKNKVIISGPPDSNETVYLESILRGAGLKPYDEVSIITNIPDEIKTGALKSGTGDYIFITEKELPEALNKGLSRVKSFKAGFPAVVCVASEDFVNNSPGALQSLVNSLYMAQTWLMYHTPGETNKVIAKSPAIEKSIGMLVEGYYVGGSPAESPVLREESLALVIGMLDRSREIPMPVSAGGLYDNRFAGAAVQSIKYVPNDKKETGIRRLKFW